MIQLKNVAKTYTGAAGDFTAIRNINLTIHAGDVFGIYACSMHQSFGDAHRGRGAL